MANIFSNNKPVGHVGRTGHDLSSSHAFVMRPSIIRPVVFQHCVPNSAFKINCADVVRTDALQTAAFLRGRQELDFFFVPYSQLFSQADDILHLREQDPISYSQYRVDSSQGFPLFSLSSLVYIASLPYTFMRICRHCDAYAAYAHEQGITSEDSLNLVELGDFVSLWIGIPGSTQSTASFTNFLRSMSYNYYQGSFFSKAKELEFVGADVLQLLSSALYGDFYQEIDYIVNDMIATEFSDFANYVHETTPVQDLVEIMASEISAEIRGFCTTIDGSWSANDQHSGKNQVNLIPLFAYQKIFYDRYRDSIVDSSFNEYVHAYSMDFFDGDVPFNIYPQGVDFVMDDVSRCPLLTFLRPRTRAFKKDLSVGLYPYASYNGYGATDDANNDEINYDAKYPTNAKEQQGLTNDKSAYSIKFALAMQRYHDMLLRAGSRTKDLLKAEFGVKSKYVLDHYVQYLGSFGGSLDLNKVSATAETGTYSVGDLAGNVFSSLSGDTIEFTCNDYGVIVGCMSFVPDVLHNSFGCSPFNRKNLSEDFYHPAFENLGLQPVSSKIFAPYAYNIGEGTPTQVITLGFAARNFEYKQNLDFVHDNFCTRFPAARKGVVIPNGTLSNYVCVKDVYQTFSQLSRRVYMLPSIMDTIFASQDTGSPDNAHFQVALTCQIAAILPMSELGLL